jgi:hypothetical protein
MGWKMAKSGNLIKEHHCICLSVSFLTMRQSLRDSPPELFVDVMRELLLLHCATLSHPCHEASSIHEEHSAAISSSIRRRKNKHQNWGLKKSQCEKMIPLLSYEASAAAAATSAVLLQKVVATTSPGNAISYFLATDLQPIQGNNEQKQSHTQELRF